MQVFGAGSSAWYTDEMSGRRTFGSHRRSAWDDRKAAGSNPARSTNWVQNGFKHEPLTTLIVGLSSLPRLHPQSVTRKANVVSRLVLRSTVYCPPVLNWLNVPCVP